MTLSNKQSSANKESTCSSHAYIHLPLPLQVRGKELCYWLAAMSVKIWRLNICVSKVGICHLPCRHLALCVRFSMRFPGSSEKRWVSTDHVTHELRCASIKLGGVQTEHCLITGFVLMLSYYLPYLRQAGPLITYWRVLNDRLVDPCNLSRILAPDHSRALTKGEHKKKLYEKLKRVGDLVGNEWYTWTSEEKKFPSTVSYLIIVSVLTVW